MQKKCKKPLKMCYNKLEQNEAIINLLCELYPDDRTYSVIFGILKANNRNATKFLLKI